MKVAHALLCLCSELQTALYLHRQDIHLHPFLAWHLLWDHEGLCSVAVRSACYSVPFT